LFEHDLFGKPVSTFPDHALADSQAKQAAPASHRVNHQTDKTPIALCGVGRYIPRSITNSGPAPREAEKSMRAEVERLVEEIKQSVGLLRRHL